MKLCIECDIEKTLDEFYRNVLTKDGRTEKCKQCLDKEALSRYLNLIEKDQKRREKNKK
jgi:hypothetical protein